MEPGAYTELAELETDHWWYRGMRNITEGLLRSHLPEQTNLSILDAGCGTGGNLTALASFGRSVGLDYSSLALEYAGEKHLGKLSRASVEALPYGENSFDLVTSFDVLYCSEVMDDVKAMGEFRRVVKPAGHVLIRVAAMPSLRGAHDAFVHGIRRYTADEMRGKLEQAGLSPIRITYANSLLLPLIYTVRKAQLILGLDEHSGQSDVKPMNKITNRLLTGVLGLEKQWIVRSHNFPAGVSLFAVAVKK